MTTIAWDGKTLAADKQSTFYNCRVRSTKIRDCGRFWYAVCGYTESTSLIEQWLRAGAKSGQCMVDEDGTHGVVIEKATATVFFAQGKRVTLFRPESPFLALGSGSDYATAAMHLGKTAREAVEIAAIYDPGTGLGVDAVDIRPRNTRKR